MRGIVDLVIHDTNLGERHFFVKKLSEPLLYTTLRVNVMQPRPTALVSITKKRVRCAKLSIKPAAKGIK